MKEKIKKFFKPTNKAGKSESGFTLIELLVVIGIIAILATIGAVNFSSARGKARDAKRVSDINQLQQTIEAEAAGATNGLFPTNWPAEALANITPAGNAAYCYYYNTAQTAYTVMARGIENADTAGSDNNPTPATMNTAAAGNKIIGSGTCVLPAAVTAAECATAGTNGTYCKIGSTSI